MRRLLRGWPSPQPWAERAERVAVENIGGRAPGAMTQTWMNQRFQCLAPTDFEEGAGMPGRTAGWRNQPGGGGGWSEGEGWWIVRSDGREGLPLNMFRGG